MTTNEKPASFLSKHSLRWASIVAFLGCAACCAIPLLAATGLGSGAFAMLARVLHPGSELLVGGALFVLTLSVLFVRSRMQRDTGCGSACKLDGSCCGRGATLS